jgi:hypothetical protein
MSSVDSTALTSSVLLVVTFAVPLVFGPFLLQETFASVYQQIKNTYFGKSKVIRNYNIALSTYQRQQSLFCML